MERIIKIVVLGAIFATVTSGDVVEAKKKPTFGAGFQATLPAWGLSGIVELDKKNSIQGVLGVVGDLKTYTGRYIYRFTSDPKGKYWNCYGYGSLGLWSHPYKEWNSRLWRWEEKIETVLGLGGGVGIEYNWQIWNPDLPPIWWNAEVGIAMVDFKEAACDVSTILFGCGAHFRF